LQFVSAIADFGGLTGLWIGASMVSMLEIVVLIYFMSKTYYGKKKASSAMAPYALSTNNLAEPSLLTRPAVVIREPSPSPSPSISHKSKTPTMSSASSEPEQKTLLDLSPSPPPVRKNTFTYIPPNKELPCQCDLDDFGKIGKMNTFCPEHGFMVRRNTDFGGANGPKWSDPKGDYRRKQSTFSDKVDEGEDDDWDDNVTSTQTNTAATEYDNA
jgi:hypothetical protein